MSPNKILEKLSSVGVNAFMEGPKLVIQPGSKVPPELLPATNAYPAADTPSARVPNAILPFPLGYRGLPPDTVRPCLAWCDAKEINDPIEIMWTVCVWVLDHLKRVRNRGPLYQKVRERERQPWTDLKGSLEGPYCDECPGGGADDKGAYPRRGHHTKR